VLKAAEVYAASQAGQPPFENAVPD
jgi:hypothetical protein